MELSIICCQRNPKSKYLCSAWRGYNSSKAASSGPPSGSAARGPIGSLSLSAESTTTLANRVTLALLVQSEVSPKLAGVATVAFHWNSAGLLRSRSAAPRSIFCSVEPRPALRSPSRLINSLTSLSKCYFSDTHRSNAVTIKIKMVLTEYRYCGTPNDEVNN